MNGRSCALGALVMSCVFTAAVAEQDEYACATAEAAVQVLGSGGPAPDVARASSAYLLWLDGRARVLVDAGGGSFVRFSESGARLEDLWLVALSHFHTDHSAELPAFLKGAWFSDRSAALAVAGPKGSRLFPGLTDFLLSMFDEERGAFRYLSGFLSGDEAFQINPVEIDHSDEGRHLVFESASLTVIATGIPHGIVPALAYRLESGGRSVVFASDQNGSSEAFIDFSRGADLMVMHMAIPEDATGGARQLHVLPSRIGEIAEEAGVGSLVLSHFMSRSLASLDAGLALVRKNYPGQVFVAQDLLCIPLTSKYHDEASEDSTAIPGM